MSWFQTVLLVIFGSALVVGALIFSGILPGFKSEQTSNTGQLILWGTIPPEKLTNFLDDFNNKYKNQFSLNYVVKDASNFNQVLTEALANGNGPDLVLSTHENLLANANRLAPISITNVPIRSFKDTFVDESLLLLGKDSFLGMPIAVDPLVLYYNKDLYNNAGLAQGPKNWEAFVLNQSKLTLVKEHNLLQSGAALGTFSNINNAKDILSMFLLQAGNPIAFYEDGKLKKTFSDDFGYTPIPAEAAFDFFLSFSDPNKTTYSWNRSWPEAREAFVAGKLANYFGLATELPYLREKNPHLNFDVALVPQQNFKNRLTFGRLYAVGALKSSAKSSLASEAAIALASQKYGGDLAKIMGIASARRDILAAGSSDPFSQVFYDGAIISKAWLDFVPDNSARIFRTLSESVSSGQSTISEAIQKAGLEMDKK